MAAPTLQIKRGNSGIGGTVPPLRPGEPAISLNNFDFYIGIDTSVANNKFFGSHRYWGREDGTNSLQVKLVDKDGSNSINLKAPNTLAGVTTYTFPATPIAGRYLSVAADGTLSWEDVTAPGVSFTDVTFSGITTITGSLDVAANSNFTGITTVDGLLDVNNGIDIFGLTELDNLNVSVAATLASARVSDLTSGRVVLAGTGGELQDNANLTFNGTALTVGTGVGITQFSGSVSTGASTSSVPTSSAVINYVTSEISAIDLTLGINADAGGPSTVNTSQTLTISGTANEVNTSVSGQTITVGLPDNVTITGDLRVNGNDILSSSGATALTLSSTDVTVGGDLTVGGNDIKASNGTTAITLDVSGGVTAAQDLTIQGNLYVNGSTTQVNSATLSVEDRTIDLGRVNGADPAGATTWDLGILFNYNASGAKKSAVIWEHSDSRFKFASAIGSDTEGVDVNTPQLTVTTFAPIEISELWVNSACSGGAQQVIGCVSDQLMLQNVVVDGGTF